MRLLFMNHNYLTSKEHQALLPLSFRTDDTHFAAPARTRPRPLDACNRVIVEFCCAEDSKLGEKRNASKGCYTIRVTEKDDATKQSTIKRLCKDLRPLLCDEGGCTAQSRPLLIWASLPCTGGCSWQHINILTNSEKVEDHHKLFLKLLKSLKSFMRIMKPFNPELAMELPKTCDYWKWAVVQAFIKKHCLQSCLCDGCMLGIVDDDGRPLRKSWQIMSTLPLPGLNGRTCNGTREHGQSRGHSLKDAESYSYHMTEAIHRDWKQHVAKTTDREISQRKSFALCCLAGSNPTPVTTMATSAERTRAFWQDIMWSAVLSEEFQAGCGDDEFEKAVRPFYANVNPQTALAASIDHLRLPGLSRLSTIANAGLSEIQPDASRGRVRYLVLVTDSFSVFLAGKHNRGDDELQGGHLQAPLGQNLAHPCRPGPGCDCRIVGGGIKNEPFASTVEIDIAVAWLGNELVGERERAVPESCLRTLEGKTLWASLPDPLRYALPHQFDECNSSATPGHLE